MSRSSSMPPNSGSSSMPPYAGFQSQRVSTALPNAIPSKSHVQTEPTTLFDVGHPLMNRVVDGIIKVGAVGALQAASKDAYAFASSDVANRRSAEKTAHQIGKDMATWGLAAGMYTGLTYSMDEARGVHDWKNALVAGALTGAAVTLASPRPRQELVFQNMITGGALATAVDFLKKLT